MLLTIRFLKAAVATCREAAKKASKPSFGIASGSTTFVLLRVCDRGFDLRLVSEKHGQDARATTRVKCAADRDHRSRPLIPVSLLSLTPATCLRWGQKVK